MSGYILNQTQKTELERVRQQQLQNISVDECQVFLPSKSSIDAVDLERLNYRFGEIHFSDNGQRERLIRKILGPGFTGKCLWFGLTGGVKRRKLYRALRHGDSLPHQLRVSTGVFALIMAISQLGDSESIVLTGIEITSVPYKYFADPKQSSAPRGHMPADLYALRTIAKKYKNVMTTSAELVNNTGLLLA